MVGGRLGKSIHDAGWHIFREWVPYYDKVFGMVVTAVAPRNTSQIDHESGEMLTRKTPGDRVHVTARGRELGRDHNAAINILQRGLQTVGWGTAEPNAWGVSVRPAHGGQETTSQESHVLEPWECQATPLRQML